MPFEGRIETKPTDKCKIASITGGLDTFFAKNAQNYSTTVYLFPLNWLPGQICKCLSEFIFAFIR